MLTKRPFLRLSSIKSAFHKKKQQQQKKNKKKKQKKNKNL